MVNEEKKPVEAASELNDGLGAATTCGGNFAALTGSPYTAELAWKLKAAESRISELEDKLRLMLISGDRRIDSKISK